MRAAASPRARWGIASLLMMLWRLGQPNLSQRPWASPDVDQIGAGKGEKGPAMMFGNYSGACAAGFATVRVVRRAHPPRDHKPVGISDRLVTPHHVTEAAFGDGLRNFEIMPAAANTPKIVVDHGSEIAIRTAR